VHTVGVEIVTEGENCLSVNFLPDYTHSFSSSNLTWREIRPYSFELRSALKFHSGLKGSVLTWHSVRFDWHASPVAHDEKINRCQHSRRRDH
jgi:hypothetical protein